MARSRERGTGSVYLKDDPNNPGQKLQTWWISYYIDGKRKRESSKSRKKSDAQALLRRRMGEHALGLEIGDEEKRLTFEDLEAGFRRSYENSGRRSLRRAGNAWGRLREHFGGWKARALTANSLESYAAERLKEAAPATVQYELAVLRRAMSLAVKKGQLRSRPHFPHVGVHNARTGFFTREEMELLAAAFLDQWGYNRMDSGYTSYSFYDFMLRDFFPFLLTKKNGYLSTPGTGALLSLGEAWEAQARFAANAAARATTHGEGDRLEAAKAEWRNLFGSFVS